MPHDLVFETPEEAARSWRWLESRRAHGGYTVGWEIPESYASYVSIPNSTDPEANGCSLLQSADDAAPDGADRPSRLLTVLSAPRGAPASEVLHCAIWDGFGGMFREADGSVEGVALLSSFAAGAHDREVDTTPARYRGTRPLRPLRPSLAYPERAYYTWRVAPSRLRDDARRLDDFTPQMVFPADRAWFWHSEIDAHRTEIGGPTALLARW